MQLHIVEITPTYIQNDNVIEKYNVEKLRGYDSKLSSVEALEVGEFSSDSDDDSGML